MFLKTSLIDALIDLFFFILFAIIIKNILLFFSMPHQAWIKLPFIEWDPET